MAEAAATPPWMVLDRLTEVLPSSLERESDMKISYKTPPLRTVLAVRGAHRLYIAAVEPTGYFLLCSSVEEGEAEQEVYICDATKGTVRRLSLAAQRSTAQNGGGGAESSMGQNLGFEEALDGERSITERLQKLGVVADLVIADRVVADRLRDLGVFADRVIGERLQELGVFADRVIADRLQTLGIGAERDDERPRFQDLGAGAARDGEGVTAEHLGVVAAQDGERVVAEHLIIDDLPRVQNIGVIAGRDGKFLIVELRQAKGAENIQARLLCFSPLDTNMNEDNWVEKEATYPPLVLPWHGDGTISYQNKIWWFSLGHGLLTCDPFADNPVLCHFPLPSGCEAAGLNQNQDLSNRRCMNVSADSMYFVILEGADSRMVIRTWSFAGESPGSPWTPGYELPLSEMWDDKNYRAMGLQRTAPEIVLVHPTIPELIYLLEGTQIFSVDLSTAEVLPFIQLSNRDQRKFIAWQLKWRPWVMLASAARCVPTLGDNREVNYPLSSGRPWNGNGVLRWNELLCWIDLSQGLVCYNIFAAQSKVRYLPFPADSDLAATTQVMPSTVQHRVVNMSGGFLRCAEMHGPEDAPVVRVWTVVINQRKKLSWRYEYDLDLKEVWSSSWFESTGLPSQMPALALVHPLDHQVLYFLQDKKIFSVNVSSPLEDMKMTVKFSIEGSAGDCRSGPVQSYVTPIETFVLVPKQ